MFDAVVFAAVSTEDQAADHRFSLPHQVDRGRRTVSERGWREAHQPLVVPGESRERFISLRDAEAAMPELKALLDLAQAGQINMVVVIDYNRFRSVMDQVVQTLAHYGCQVYSLTQPVEPLPPDRFSPYLTDSTTIMVSTSQMVSRLQIADLRRKFQVGMPKRVDKLGIPLSEIPYGYRKPPGRELDHRAVPIQVAEECAVLLRMKAEYLAGNSARGIARLLTGEKVPSPQAERSRSGAWSQQIVNKILTNPFYCGFVVRNASRQVNDPRTGKGRRIRLPRDEWVLAPGKHTPLWTVEDYEQLVALQDAAGQRRRGQTKSTQPLSRLMVCAGCDAHLWAYTAWGWRNDTRVRKYRCPNGYPGQGHAAIRVDRAHEQLRVYLEALMVDAPAPAPDPATLALLDAQIKHSQNRLVATEAAWARYQRALGDGLISYEDLAARKAEVAAERERHTETLLGLEREVRRHKRLQGAQTELTDLLADYDALLAGPPEVANLRFTNVLAQIRVDHNKIVAVIQRAD